MGSLYQLNTNIYQIQFRKYLNRLFGHNTLAQSNLQILHLLV